MQKEIIYSCLPESTNIEFKQDLPKDSSKYTKTAVAFANGRGGKLVFGVRDTDHVVTGNLKSTEYELSNV